MNSVVLLCSFDVLISCQRAFDMYSRQIETDEEEVREESRN